MSGNILVVDDDKEIVQAIAINLEQEGFRVFKAYDGLEALEIAMSQDLQLIIIDVMMPKLDGLSAVLKIRERKNFPIMILSAKSEDTDKVLGLSMGADDYLTKPFSVAELLARVRVALRRVAFDETEEEAGETYRNGDLAIDFDAKVVVRGDDEIHLTPIEYKLLVLLARNTGKVLTHNYILKEVWGQALTSDLPSLRVFMATLRKKIEPDPASPVYLQTHVGIGYRMLRVE